MSYPIETKEKAKKLRTEGYSLNEISQSLGIYKSTASVWLNNIKLNQKAQKRLERRHILGQYKAMVTAKAKRNTMKDEIDRKSTNSIKNIMLNKELYKLLCSFLFWTEGGKSTDSYVFFTNSDPKMVATFIKLIRNSYRLDENKFRAMVHIHEYHNEEDIKEYWSKVTGIPLTQFSKSYKKPNTGKRVRDGYKGTIRVRYYDYKIALELRSFYNTFVRVIGL
jgi:hypothetical protein